MQKKSLVTLVFKRQELLYDIENYSFVEGDIMHTENEHAKHQVMDIGQDGNIDRVTRMLDLGYSECVNLMYPYTRIPVELEEKRDDTLTEKQEYEIRMLVPAEFSKTTVTLLEQLIHEYLVCRVLSDWMGITNPDSKSNWEHKVTDIKEKISTCLNTRCKKIRRTLGPF